MSSGSFKNVSDYSLTNNVYLYNELVLNNTQRMIYDKTKPNTQPINQPKYRSIDC